jgi:hypothetical protein
MAASTSTASAAGVLRRRLDDTAAALSAADLPRLLACEAEMQTALASLASHWPVSGDRAQLAVELEQIRVSLTRCRRLGGSLMQFVDASLAGLEREPATHTFNHSA